MQGGSADNFVSVYSDARHEYIRQLGIFLVPAYFKWYISLFERAKETTASEPKKALWQFQNYLGEIPDWNMEKVNNEIGLIQQSCGCDYIEDLLTAVFIAHTKVLTAIRLSTKHKKVQITVPKVEHFLFKVLCETGKLLWGSSYLFSENLPSIERQKNYRNIENLIGEGIHQAVRAMVPVKSILKDFINQDDGNGEENGEVNEGDNEETLETPLEPLVPTKIPEVTETPEKPETTKTPENNVELAKVISTEEQTNSKNIPVEEQVKETPIINLDDSKQVLFTEYDTVFKPSDPEASEIVYEPKDGDSDITSDSENDEQFNFDLSDSNELPIEPDSELSETSQQSTSDENAELKIDDAEVLA